MSKSVLDKKKLTKLEKLQLKQLVNCKKKTMFPKILSLQTICENILIILIGLFNWNELINLNASLLHKFVQFVHIAGIEICGRNRDRNWVTGIGIEVWLQESGSKLGYRNWDRSWWRNWWDRSWDRIETGRRHVLLVDRCWWTPVVNKRYQLKRYHR